MLKKNFKPLFMLKKNFKPLFMLKKNFKPLFMLKKNFKPLFFYLCFWMSLAACQSQSFGGLQFPKIVYQSEDLKVVQIAPDTFVHTSYLATQQWGKVPCNGMIVRHQREAMVFDTPTDEASSEALIHWIKNELKAEIKWVVPTHFHDDNLGGLPAFHRDKIMSIAYYRTQNLSKKHRKPQTITTFSATDSTWNLGGAKIQIGYYGKGHTEDNIVVYFPKDQVLFGGCLVKELGAGKGNLSDAFPKEWSATIQKVKHAYPEAKIVVPGHGKIGDKALLDYTAQLFKP
ncbi:subclass B1 metallo-beta-lactamase [Ornithobacterium rhinotracheale]|uniref:beta-lactamase n=6 Tax=Ornithobacterium rhinotracheale TaxID=28251 RepID=I3ZY32_ORNRL|nr:subclass B1 metallo-beta-lactamase [Ornithobacterium rhinotracheale]AFL96616.1 Zn-dependent hydrolase, glyoxylase [Ornithobacterium rhinotracheale DSM 15997]MCK0195234.1 subclass B1 metallo-beta-lactamase [Ornithobacterium rhinotracheale]